MDDITFTVVVPAVDTPVEIADTAIEKKRPGRPRKKILNIPVTVHGIVATPANGDDLVELVYENPTMFKNLLRVYKQFSVSELELVFTKTAMKINARDHLGVSTIYTTIEGKHMNLYYCKETVRITVKRESLEKILSCTRKNHYKITFALKEKHRSLLYIIIEDLDYSSKEINEIEVNSTAVSIPEPDDDDTMYPIKFRLSTTHFKDKISSIKKISKVFTIQKTGISPLQLTGDKEQKINWTAVYTDKEKIILESTVVDDDIFNASVFIEYIKPFATSNVGEEVFICADKTKKMSFTTFLDKKIYGYSCMVKVFVDIIKL